MAAVANRPAASDRDVPASLFPSTLAYTCGPSPQSILSTVAKLVAEVERVHVSGEAHGSLSLAAVTESGITIGDGAGCEDADFRPPERRPGQNPVPRHDVYAIGVVWAKLLAGSRGFQFRPGWERQLELQHGAPLEQVALIQKCVGWVGDRPADAAVVASLIRGLGEHPPAAAGKPPPLAPIVSQHTGSGAESKGSDATDASERGTIASRLLRAEALLADETKATGRGKSPVIPLIFAAVAFAIGYGNSDSGRPIATALPAAFWTFLVTWILSFVIHQLAGSDVRAAATEKVFKPLVKEYPSLFIGWENPDSWTSEYVAQVRQKVESGDGLLTEGSSVSEPPSRRVVAKDELSVSGQHDDAGKGGVQQPHRGTVVFAIGILGIFLPLLAPIAWSMGSSDLKAMGDGRMDRAGEANTRTGTNVGTIATLIYGGLIVVGLLART